MRLLSHIAFWLVKHRILLFVTMALLAVGSIFLIPHVNLNGDMTIYLPDDSPMKQGMDLMAEHMPAIQEYMQTEGNLVVDGMQLMPKDLPQTIATGVAFVFLVLLVMSSSVMEVLLFLLTIGFAVAINLGTNAFFSSVSTLTNSLALILQMVLSMDYSIILMNRYRQEKNRGALPLPAMVKAVDRAASSILSSAFTTIVSLLMLVFMKLKIGADLGYVLAKGVALSLLCNFTVLPALIIWSDKAIDRTKKKIPRVPAGGIARFEYRFRWGITVLFLAAFVAFSLLQRRTQLYFAPNWDSQANDDRNNVNAMMLLYETGEESAVPAILDDIAADSLVQQCISYPSLVDRPRTIADLKDLVQEAGEEAPELPEELLRLVYYAHSHPERTEKLSLEEVAAYARELRPDQPMDFAQMMAAPAKPRVSARKEPAPAVVPAVPDTVSALPGALPDTVAVAPVVADTVAAAPVDPRLIYEEVMKERSAADMAAFLDWDSAQVAMAYRMAGKRKGKMTMPEFMDYVKKNVLGNRRFAAFVSKDMVKDFAAAQAQVDSVLAAGPSVKELPAVPVADTTVFVAELPPEAVVPAVEEPVAPEEEETVPDVAPTPQERLVDMYLSGRRYSAARIHAALSAAGVPVSREEVDLLFLYAGAQRDFDARTAIAPGTLLAFVADTLLQDPVIAPMVPDSVRTRVASAREELLGRAGMLRSPVYSAAVVMSRYDQESEKTFDYVTHVRTAADEALQRAHYWVGESEMYKELKDGFPQELLLLTLLTILAIFVIVAVTFRSVIIPIPLLMTILAGIYANVWASGLGGRSMYYMSYLIIQGILMGATIDYTILFMTYYLAGRKKNPVSVSLEGAYKGASHSILTSGLILAIVPFVMSLVMSDKVIGSILSSLAVGTTVILLFVFLLLPGTIAALDPLFRRKPGQKA